MIAAEEDQTRIVDLLEAAGRESDRRPVTTSLPRLGN